MAKIQLMRPELANLIAAGEVIERPSSVIKELVENSIDAGASNIYVGVSDAGKGTILVRDDGSGMDREDATTCFLRHASSKIKTEYDLSRIHTLGFRGEAIPSIAAVSKVTLTTSTGEGAGTRIESEPNHELVVSDAPSRKGTVFEIRSLFYNTPARLKYLKSNQVETYSIIETVEHLALGFPNISFSLGIDGKEIFHTSGRGDLLETIQKIYGNTIAKSLYPIQKETLTYSFSGYIGKPEINYSRRKDMLTFLNQRCIYDYKINKAIEDAYRDYLPPLRYPFTVIDLKIDASLVDVNVHPTKKEVRISLEDDIARDIKNEILSLLEEKKPIYFASEDSKSEKLMSDSTGDFDFSEIENREKEEVKVQQDYSSIPPFHQEKENSYFQESIPYEPTYESTTKQTNLSNENQFVNQIPVQENKYYKTIFEQESSSFQLPEMHPIGQVLQTYVLCDGINCFYILDQHAAAERVNYEKTQALFESIKTRIVPLFPITLELSPKEKLNYDEDHIQRLASLGIICEDFGNNTIKIVEIPAFLSERNDEEVIFDCVHSCLNNEASDPISLLHLTIANIACKKSIKANHQMSMLEIEALLKDLSKCKNPANCPHGRPTIIKITREDVERIFRRSGF